MSATDFTRIFNAAPEPPKGVWAVLDRNYGETITEVHPTEVEALRVLNNRGHGRVVFVPWGTTLNDLEAGK